MSANNEAAKTLRIGLIASGESVERLRAAIAACGEVTLAAQAGVPQSAADPSAEWFDDRRVLIAQSSVDAVVLAISPRVDTELTIVAAEHGKHVFRVPPLGRNFADAVEVVRRIRAAGVVLRAVSAWEPRSATIRSVLERTDGFRAIFSEAQVSARGPALQSPWSNMVESGGGVLLCDGYALLESIIAVRDLPESVHADLGRCRGLGSGTPRETEDFVAAVLRYEGGGAAAVRVAWDLGPTESRVIHHGASASLVVDDAGVGVLAPDFQESHRRTFDGDDLASELQQFVRDARTPTAVRSPDDSTERHIAVSAVIEAIYLSARTGQPEIPRKLFEVQSWAERVR